MQLTSGAWPSNLPAVQVRFTRPTDSLEEVVEFYTDLLGLPELYRTTDRGYEVVMIGMPGDAYHLEFTRYIDGSPGRAPTDENLLVLYFSEPAQMYEVVERLGNAGREPVALENPWWEDHGALAFPDPDNWRVVLMPKPIPLM